MTASQKPERKIRGYDACPVDSSHCSANRLCAPVFPPVIAVVVGAGAGKRFGSPRPKAFARLSSGETLLHLTLRRLAASPLVAYQVAIVPKGYEKKVAHWPDRAALRLVSAVPGGKHRSQSVLIGLRAAKRFLSGADAVVLIHDAARPLVSPALVERVVKGVLEHGNATPAVPVSDTIKEAQNHRFTRTLDRSRLYAVQTPQGFRLSEHLRVLELHPGAHLDDTIPWSIEKKDVFRVEGDRWNIKVTYPEDLRLVEALLPLLDAEESDK